MISAKEIGHRAGLAWQSFIDRTPAFLTFGMGERAAYIKGFHAGFKQGQSALAADIVAALPLPQTTPTESDHT